MVVVFEVVAGLIDVERGVDEYGPGGFGPMEGGGGGGLGRVLVGLSELVTPCRRSRSGITAMYKQIR